jgi:dihydrodipicolinate synthase/N-acetylneuraminate lyase
VKRSVAWRPSAFQVLLPDWSAPNLDEVIAFLERMAAAAEPIGLVVYNPPHAKKVLTPAEWQIVADRVPQVVGMKVGGGDARWFEAMRPLFSRLSVFVPGHKLASGFKLGAAGSYSNVACMSPRGAVRWFEMMQREPERALELEQRILRFFGAHIIPFIAEQKYSNSAADKLLAAIGGWAPIGTRLRWPYRWIDEGEARRLRAVAEADLPELFDEAYRNGQNLKNCRKNTSATT